MLTVEPGSKLAGLTCRVCHFAVRPGECVLVAYRKGEPSVIHAHVCSALLPPQHPLAGQTQLPT